MMASTVLGSMVGGALLAAELSTQTIFLMLAVPAVLAAFALLAMGRLQQPVATAPVMPLQPTTNNSLT